MDELSGKVAVVTGSASGLGKGIAERFAREGMTVVVADNRLPAAQGVAQAIESEGGRAVAAEVDVTDRQSVEDLNDWVDRALGGTTILVNNAGVVSYSPVLEPEEKGWHWIVDVNLYGVVHGLQAFLPGMVARGNPCHVVNVASLAGVVGGGGVVKNRIAIGDGVPDKGAMFGYMATKHAVVAITESLAGQMSGSPVGVSVLLPSHHEHTGIWENSPKYRPEHYGGPMSEEEYRGIAGTTQEKATESRLAFVREPDECAARVVHAIRQGHFYIFTHPETRPAVEHRFAQLMAAYDDAEAFKA